MKSISNLHRKNSRNGKSSKRIKTEDGEFELDTPRDRNGSFDPLMPFTLSFTSTVLS